MLLFVVLPALIFGVPALLGHPVLLGDDMTQNFPLRVLVGRDIRAGRLPLFDPYIWSGSPLLAGWNAGAAYPLTLLFAVLPGVAAWTFGLMITSTVACVGMFSFLRALRLGSLASFLGALSFALAGAMSAQVVHFGLVAGMSWVPLALLAVLRLSDPQGRPLASRLGWIATLGVALGLVILAGEPRAIADGGIIVAVYAIWQVARLRRRALPALLSVSGGAALGLGFGAIQWLPGLAAISTSQRGNGSLALFSSGSLPVRWLLLTVVPDLLGGSGSLSQPSFFASYNLTEVTSYVGLLPLVAAFAMLARVRWRPRVPDWLIWHVLAVVGVVLALGGNTPLGSLLYRIPLFGGQRLQSRNILVLDLALAVLLAYWVDHPFPARVRAGSQHGPFGIRVAGLVRGWRPRGETLLGLLPPLGMLTIVLLGLTWGAGLLHWLGGAGAAANTSVISRLDPWLLPYAVIAVGAMALVVFGWRLRPQWRARLCAGFVITDLIVFSVLAIVSVAPSGSSTGTTALAKPGPAAVESGLAAGSGLAMGSASSTGTTLTARTARPSAVTSVSPRSVAALGYQGRYAIYDPGLLDGSDLSALVPPDLNDMSASGMPSVQGYTSLVDGAYASATGSHDATGEGQNVLSPAAIGNGTLDQLDTSVLLTVPAYLTTTAGDAASAPSAPADAGRRDIAAHQSTAWYLGAPVVVSRIEVPDADARADAAAGTTGTEIGLTTASGTTLWLRGQAVSSSELAVNVPAGVTAIAVVARSGNVAVQLGAPSVVQRGGPVLIANGRLQNELVPPRWDLTGFDGSFAVFSDRFASGLLTIKALPGQSASGASVRDLSGGPDDPLAAAVSSAHGIQLIRSVAAIPGWSAAWQPADGGPAVKLPVRTDGLVQVVDVPAGRGTVTWRYMSPHFMAGLALSIVAVLLILLLALASRWRGTASLVPRLRNLRGPGKQGDLDEELLAQPSLEPADVLGALALLLPPLRRVDCVVRVCMDASEIKLPVSGRVSCGKERGS